MPNRKETISSMPPNAEPIKLLAKAADFCLLSSRSEIKIRAEKKRGRLRNNEPNMTRSWMDNALNMVSGTRN